MKEALIISVIIIFIGIAILYAKMCFIWRDTMLSLYILKRIETHDAEKIIILLKINREKNRIRLANRKSRNKQIGSKSKTHYCRAFFRGQFVSFNSGSFQDIDSD